MAGGKAKRLERDWQSFMKALELFAGKEANIHKGCSSFLFF